MLNLMDSMIKILVLILSCNGYLVDMEHFPRERESAAVSAFLLQLPFRYGVTWSHQAQVNNWLRLITERRPRKWPDAG